MSQTQSCDQGCFSASSTINTPFKPLSSCSLELKCGVDEIECEVGWKIKADDKFAIKHGNEMVPVRKGIDNATHLNLVTNYAEVSGITPAR